MSPLAPDSIGCRDRVGRPLHGVPGAHQALKQIGRRPSRRAPVPEALGQLRRGPKVVAQVNGQEVKLVKVQGVFPWHHHEHEDEMFLVWRGQMTIEFRERRVVLASGEFCVVPRGVDHRTMADDEAEILVFEPAATRNTGNVVDERFTAPNGVAI